MSSVKKKKRALVLFDLTHDPPKGQDYSEFNQSTWEVEGDVSRALKKLGYEAEYFGVYQNVQELVDELVANPPALVFNLCESAHSDREYEPNIAALLELMRIPFTGAGSAALRLCKDKGMTKKILAYHKILVPKFYVARTNNPITAIPEGFRYPIMVKPSLLEASEGITQASVVDTEKDCLERIQHLHEKLNADAIIEEYIDGREIYVGVMGNKKLTVFPPREMTFFKVPEGEPKIATYKAKWDPNYRKKWGIQNRFAKGISKELLQKINSTAKTIYKVLRIDGYARFDMRLTEKGELYFIEANPNPNIARWEDFAQGAEKAGVEYPDLIDKIIKLAS